MTLADIEAARRVIAGHVLRTPMLPAPRLSALTGAEVFVKYENLQVTNSFPVDDNGWPVIYGLLGITFRWNERTFPFILSFIFQLQHFQSVFYSSAMLTLNVGFNGIPGYVGEAWFEACLEPTGNGLR